MVLKRLIHKACFIAVAAVSASVASARTAGSYKGAIATDALSGAVLFEDNADAVSPPASMTKLMTFAVLSDELKRGTIALDTQVTVTPEDARVAMLRKSTEVWLKQGEVFSVEDLIYAMMVQSANDAAYTLAHRAGGTVDEFVAKMNAKARELGMTHSTFRSPHGYPPPSRRIADGDLTTPRDYSVLCRYLLLHTDVLKYSSVKTRTFGWGSRMVVMTNHNHLLGRIAGVDGLKTGFTDGAGFCLSATAERAGRRIIVVMMDSPDSRTRDLNVQQLISEAFAALPLGEKPFEPSPTGPSQPTRPAPPVLTPDGAPVVRYPGAGGS
jgi:D-alanyl-D-alanine carboxypeptidase (penicillin-binding protein 5/6)